MADKYSDTWCVEDRLNPEFPGHYETIFTLCNGYMGMRAHPGFSPFSCETGYYAAGIFNKTPYFKSEPVNMPLPFNYTISTKTGDICFDACAVVDSSYLLDMKKGALKMMFILRDKSGRKTKIEEERFLHLKNKQLAVMRAFVTPLNYGDSARLRVAFDLEKAYTTVKGSRVYHLLQKAMELINNGLYLETETNHTRIKTGQYLKMKAKGLSGGVCEIDDEYIGAQYEMKLVRNRRFSFEIYSSLFTSAVSKNIEKDSVSLVNSALKKGYTKTLLSHGSELKKAWDMADVRVKGDAYAQKIIRYNIFNLIGLAPPRPGISIGAKGLHGEGYRGHAFWDTELFLLPFYLFTDPAAASHLMKYRAERLEPARQYAKKLGYKGARFPWESADTGHDVTPDDAHTVNQEHIISDIVHAVKMYIDATGGSKLKKELDGLIIESARYCASRVEFDKKKKMFVIKNAIGPDEFHQDIDNSFYTNYMFIKTLEAGIKAAANKRNTAKEIKKWDKISRNMFLPFSKKAGFHEQFEGYFKLKDVKMKIDKKGNRILSDYMMSRYNSPEAPSIFGKTKLLKQADAVMLYYLFYNDFPVEMIRKAYEYYEPRTTHGSSLSRCSYVIVAARLGKKAAAYRDFLRSAELDLKDMKNKAGIHAASLGGVWKILFYGFGGISVNSKSIKTEPRLPAKWKSMEFKFIYRGTLINYSLTKKKLVLKKLKGAPINIEFRGRKQKLRKVLVLNI